MIHYLISRILIWFHCLITFHQEVEGYDKEGKSIFVLCLDCKRIYWIHPRYFEEETEKEVNDSN